MTIRRLLNRAALVSAGISALCVAQAVSAQSLSYADVTFSAGAQYASNPFLVSGSNAGAASANIEVRPSVHLERERSQLTASAFYQRSEYQRSYGGIDGYGGGVSGSYQLSPKALLTTSVDYSNSILVAGDIFRTSTITNPDGSVSQIPIVPGTVDPALGDVGLLGTRQRRSLLSESVALNLTASQRDSLNFSISGSRSRYPNAAANISNYRQLGAGFSYSRRLSESRTIGFRVGFSDVDYDGSSLASRVYSPELTLTQQLSGSWSISAAAGATFVEQSNVGSSNSSTSFSFSLNACRRGELGNFCLNASRSALASAVDGVRPQTVVGISYGRKLDRLTNINLTASYSRSSLQSVLVQSANQDYYYSDLSLSRQLGKRLNLTAGAGVQGIEGQSPQRSANFSGRIGLSYSLGTRK